MGRPPAARRGDRGGEGIPALRPLRLRLTGLAAALALAAGLAVYPIVRAGVLAPVAAALAGVGLLSLGVSAARRSGPGAGVFALAAEYVLVEATGRAPADSVLAYGVGFVVLAEVLLRANDLPAAGLVERSVVAEQVLVVAAIAIAACLLALVAVAATGVRLGGAPESAALGTAAAVLLLAVPRLLLRRTASRRSGPAAGRTR